MLYELFRNLKTILTMAETESAKKLSSQQRKGRYCNLLNRVERLREDEDVGINTVKEVGHIIQEANSIDQQCDFLQRVEYADETLIESVVLSSASGLMVKCLEQVNIHQVPYEPLMFASKILNSIKQTDEQFEANDWLNILETARAIVPELPNYQFLYGSFDPAITPTQKEKKRTKREAQEKVEKKSLQTVKKVDKEEEGIEETVNFLLNVLNDEYTKNQFRAIPYYDFVVDSESFSSTVENMFYVSFLVREGKVELSVGKDDIPLLQPKRKRQLNEFRDDGGVNSQMIASITMEDWEVLRNKSGSVEKHRKRRS